MHNFIVNITDTDSISFCKSNMAKMDLDEIKLLVREINDISPEFMQWENDGYYDSVLCLKTKNYVLVKGNDYTYRGSSLRDTKREFAVREMLKQMIHDIIENESNNLINIYHSYIKEALNIKDVTRWQTKKTVTKSVLDGADPDARLNESKVLDAIHEAINRGIMEEPQEGDKLYFYNDINGVVQAEAKGELIFLKSGEPKMVPNYIIRDARLWTGEYDKEHYVNRVYKTVEILKNVVDMDLFVDYGLKRNKEALITLTSGV